MPPPPTNFWLIYTALLHFIILFIFWSCIACPPIHTSTTVSLHQPSLRSLFSQPQPAPHCLSWALKPQVTCPFMSPLPQYLWPHSIYLKMTSIPVDPCGFYPSTVIESNHPPHLPSSICRPILHHYCWVRTGEDCVFLCQTFQFITLCLHALNNFMQWLCSIPGILQLLEVAP